ncbi:hypothetical protein E3T35_12765 [Cryobacterium sp. TMT1-2-2]|uniref:hypothetical protein n=1 Tax=Cryobacterium sp. TMT1-2-2 TaxID=1259233 RepID=UPI00106DA1E0|nr:hypothetical protein [Cryobacterium sp. TMT1-2-2]TFD10599.1 hypothetical protein E3T35_12765 [Cryobacterium sp. TMT1-2-2]
MAVAAASARACATRAAPSRSAVSVSLISTPTASSRPASMRLRPVACCTISVGLPNPWRAANPDWPNCGRDRSAIVPASNAATVLLSRSNAAIGARAASTSASERPANSALDPPSATTAAAARVNSIAMLVMI